MPLDYLQLKDLSEALEKRLVTKHLSHFIHYSADVCYFHIGRTEKLVFCLKGNDPYVYISSTETAVSSLNTPFATTIRKDLGNAFVNNVSILNEDRIIEISLTTINEVFKEEQRFLIAELIPNKTNLILLGPDRKVLGSLHPSNNESRPLLRGLIYEVPEKKPFGENRKHLSFDFDSYNSSCIDKEGLVSEERKKERYHSLYLLVARKIKSSKRKVEAISKDIEEAKKHMDDGKYGDYIFTNFGEIDPSKGFMTIEGKQIALEKSLSSAKNAQRFYQRAKKSKTTYKMGQENLNKALKEGKEGERLSWLLENSNESGLESMEKELGLSNDPKNKKANKKTASIINVRESAPYFIKDGDTTYLFGKSAIQNDFLSFLYDTSKKHTWMHLLGHTGAHLIIKKDDATREEIALAAEFLCLCSSLEDGTAMYALRKDVRKGHVPGEALVEKYQSLKVTSISQKARDLFKTAKRIKE